MQDQNLTRRERSIMDILFAEPGLGVAEVQARMPDEMSYSAVRAALSRLVEKRCLSFTRVGAKYVYQPDSDRQQAGVSALQRVMDTFFAGSPAAAIDAVLGFATERIDEQERLELLALLDSRSRSTIDKQTSRDRTGDDSGKIEQENKHNTDDTVNVDDKEKNA